VYVLIHTIRCLQKLTLNPRGSGPRESEEVSAFDQNQPKISSQDTQTPQYGFTVLAIGWWKEIASLLVAVLALIAIALILSMYNRQEQPAWKYSLNLSTLTAILSVLLRVAMVIIAQEVMALFTIISLPSPY
jgi:lipopolysaccharide export LptBFGC system permease protein LptF